MWIPSTGLEVDSPQMDSPQTGLDVDPPRWIPPAGLNVDSPNWIGGGSLSAGLDVGPPSWIPPDGLDVDPLSWTNWLTANSDNRWQVSVVHFPVREEAASSCLRRLQHSCNYFFVSSHFGILISSSYNPHIILISASYHPHNLIIWYILMICHILIIWHILISAS